MARAALGWSVQKLGELTGMTPNTVSRFENGKDAYTSTAKKLEDALLNSGRIRFDGDCCVCCSDE